MLTLTEDGYRQFATILLRRRAAEPHGRYAKPVEQDGERLVSLAVEAGVEAAKSHSNPNRVQASIVSAVDGELKRMAPDKADKPKQDAPKPKSAPQTPSPMVRTPLPDGLPPIALGRLKQHEIFDLEGVRAFIREDKTGKGIGAIPGVGDASAQRLTDAVKAMEAEKKEAP